MGANKMKIFFIGELYYSALCLKSILDEGIPIAEVFTTKDTTDGLTRTIQKIDSDFMRKKGYEHEYYWTRTQRFLKVLLEQERKSSNRVTIGRIHEFLQFDIELLEYFSDSKPDIIIVAGLSKRVPFEFLNIPKYGFINFHSSLLPEYKGPSPEFYIIQNGESKSGLTAHRMNEYWDDGEILAQEIFDISESDCVGDLEVKAGTLAGRLFRRTLEHVGDMSVSKMVGKGSYFSSYPEDDLIIYWSATAQKNQRLIRAKPEGYGITYLEGEKIYITHSRISASEPRTGVGTVFKVDCEGAHVKCEEGSIIIQNAVYSTGLNRYLKKPVFKEGVVLG